MKIFNADQYIDNVEKVIWEDLSDVKVSIIARVQAFTNVFAEQAFAVVWDVVAM